MICSKFLLQQKIKEEGTFLARRSDRISMGVKSGFRRRLLRRSGRQRIGFRELRDRCRLYSRRRRLLEWTSAAAGGKREGGTDQRKSETITDQASPQKSQRSVNLEAPSMMCQCGVFTSRI